MVVSLPHAQVLQKVQSDQEVQQGQGGHVHHQNQEHPVCLAHPEVDKKYVVFK